MVTGLLATFLSPAHIDILNGFMSVVLWHILEFCPIVSGLEEAVPRLKSC